MASGRVPNTHMIRCVATAHSHLHGSFACYRALEQELWLTKPILLTLAEMRPNERTTRNLNSVCRPDLGTTRQQG